MRDDLGGGDMDHVRVERSSIEKHRRDIRDGDLRSIDRFEIEKKRK